MNRMMVSLGLLLLLGACSTPGAVNTGTVMELTSRRICISVAAPGGLDRKCFRIGDDTDLEDGVERGDAVEIRFDKGEALSVEAIPPPE